MAVPQLELDDTLDVVLPNGEVYRLRPGPYGKGIAVVARKSQAPRKPDTPGTGKRGRKPRAGTLLMRELAAEAAKSGHFLDTKEYVARVQAADPTISLNVARQTVYRELRNAQ